MVLDPIYPNDLREKLTEGVVQFAFHKKDGTLRLAVGTTNLTLIPIDSHPNGRGKFTPRSVTFFDMEKRMWRSVSAEKQIFIAG